MVRVDVRAQRAQYFENQARANLTRYLVTPRRSAIARCDWPAIARRLIFWGCVALIASITAMRTNKGRKNLKVKARIKEIILRADAK
jgi:hypothetical protein